MIDSATGMKPGERYCVESLEPTHHFSGFFLDGKYYLGPDLLTAVGWLDGQNFVYDELDPSGNPVFPESVAGIIEDLTLTMADGASFKLHGYARLSRRWQLHRPCAQAATACLRSTSGREGNGGMRYQASSQHYCRRGCDTGSIRPLCSSWLQLSIGMAYTSGNKAQCSGRQIGWQLVHSD